MRPIPNPNQPNFYNPILNSKTELSRPLRAAVITSVRDTGASDQNGRMIQLPEFDEVYMMGVIEAFIRSERHRVHELLEIVGVITDDTEADNNRGHLDGYTAQPNEQGDWIFDREIRNQNGELLTNFTENIPSDFRSLPLRMTDERAISKENFENEVARTAKEMGADILISDHLMLRAENLVRLFRNRFLNIHPAVTNITNPNRLRGKIPTQDAIDRANGFRINHETGLRESIEPYNLTGATLHFINEVIDDGPPICDLENTTVRPDDTPQQLRYRNYQNGKIPVFINGLTHYAENIYPQIEQEVA